MFESLFRRGGNSIDVNELEELLPKINLIDIREPYEYKVGHLKGAKNIPMNIIVAQSEKYLDESKEYHIICHSGARSSKTCSILKHNGFNVINVSGGTVRYKGKLER